MQRYITILLFFLFVSGVRGQQIVQKRITYQNPDSVAGIMSFEEASPYFYFIVGTATSSLLYKTDTLLNKIWVKEVNNDSAIAYLIDIVRIANDSLVLYGGLLVYDSNTFKYTYYGWIAKTDTALNITQSRFFKIPNMYYSYLRVCNGDFIIYGLQRIDPVTDQKLFVVALDSDFNVKWGNSIKYMDYIEECKLVEVPGNGMIIQARGINCTNPNPPSPDTNVMLLRLNQSGNILWAQRSGTFNNNLSPYYSLYNSDITIDAQGNFLNSFTTTFWRLWGDNVVQKLDPNGNEIGCRVYANILSIRSELNSINVRPDNNILQLVSHSEAILTDENLNVIYRRKLNTMQGLSTVFYSQHLLSSNRTILTGSINANPISPGIIVITDSISDIGCGNNGFLNLPDFPTSFGSTDISNDVTFSHISFTDTLFSVNFTNSTLLNEYTICQTTTNIPETNQICDYNPQFFSDRISLECTQSIAAIKIVNILGQTIKSSPANTSVYIGDIQPGIYLLTILDKNNILKTVKFIKQ